MPGSTPDNQQRPGRGDVYWRRRVIALAAGIAVIGLVGWTLNGVLGGGSVRPSANVSSVTSHLPASPTALPTLITPIPSPSATGSASPGATPTPTTTGKSRASAKASASSRPKHRSQRAGHQPQAGNSGQACPAADIVLSVFTSKYSYRAHAMPHFQVDVVSTAPRPCHFALGPRHVQLLIRAGGERRVWDSGDCAQSSGAQVTRLARGVPQVLRISWDRQTSAPRCHLPRRPAQPGSYTATAVSGHLRSQSLIFVLYKPGIAVP
jgi:hypothetical protein